MVHPINRARMAPNLIEGRQCLTAERSSSSTAVTMSVGHESMWAQRARTIDASCNSRRVLRRNKLASAYTDLGWRAAMVALATANAPATETSNKCRRNAQGALRCQLA